jgi:Holliday junction resolvase
MKEKDLTNQIRSFLKVCGVFHYKQHQGLGSTPGVPDIIGIYDGKFLGIEIKGERGKVSVKQQDFIDCINQHGGIAFIARSVDDVARHLGINWLNS